jgi:hypothetical protein
MFDETKFSALDFIKPQKIYKNKEESSKAHFLLFRMLPQKIFAIKAI